MYSFFYNTFCFLRVYGIGILTFCLFMEFLKTFDIHYLYEVAPNIPSAMLIYGFLSIVGIAYLWGYWDILFQDHRRLHDVYLHWIKGKSGFILFLLSIPLSLFSTLVQLGIIITLERFTPLSPPIIADIGLLGMIIIAFIGMKKYLFSYTERDHGRLMLTFIAVSALNLFVNYISVEWVYRTLLPELKILIPFLTWLTNFVTDTAISQFLVSAGLGWIWFLVHKNITFKKQKLSLYNPGVTS